MLTPPAPVWLGESRLFGLYHPGHSPCPPVVMLNSGLLAHAGPYGLYTELAASLSKQGIPCLRVDESGKGESAQKPLPRALALQEDIAQIADFLRSEGHQQIVLLGICSGADNALELAANRDDIAGLVLLDGYAPRTLRFHARYLFERLTNPARVLGWLTRQLRTLGGASPGASPDASPASITPPPDGLDTRQWLSPKAMRDCYTTILARPCPTLALFTGALRDSYYNSAGTLSNALGQPAALTELYRPEMSHLYPSTSQRAKLRRLVCDWLVRTYDLPAAVAVTAAPIEQEVTAP